jgi:hypothetical protein
MLPKAFPVLSFGVAGMPPVIPAVAPFAGAAISASATPVWNGSAEIEHGANPHGQAISRAVFVDRPSLDAPLRPPSLPCDCAEHVASASASIS